MSRILSRERIPKPQDRQGILWPQGQTEESVFLGHFGLGFAGKRVAPRVSLGALFLGVQFADLLFWVLALAGIEHFRIQP